MFNINEYYEACGRGHKVDSTEMFDYIKSFKNIIIWGASYQGKAIEKLLRAQGITVSFFWDKRYTELGEVNGIKVEKTYHKEFDRSTTIIIYCIPNHVIMTKLVNELTSKGYQMIRGDILYSGTLCNYNLESTLSPEKCWKSGECRSVICNKAATIIKNKGNEKKPGERIDLTYCVFIVNSICNLSCTHCVQFINNYPSEARKNIPYELVAKDIDVFLSTIDTVGTISVMGGETFMHPEIGKIAQKFYEHKNFGFISFPTNGVFPMKPEQLELMNDPRTIIAFGYYLHVANEKQKEIYQKNIELVKSFGITYTESLQLPMWIVPSELYKLPVDERYMTILKQNCKMPPRNLQVADGKVHICDKSVALHRMGMVDYPNDYMVLDAEEDLQLRRNTLRELIDKPFYYTCGHCYNTQSEVTSAIQGVRDVFTMNDHYKNKINI